MTLQMLLLSIALVGVLAFVVQEVLTFPSIR